MLKVRWRIPKPFVIPSDAYWACLDYLREEMYSEADLEWFGQLDDGEIPEFDEKLIPEAVWRISEVLACVWWLRRERTKELCRREVSRTIVAMIETQKEQAIRASIVAVDPIDPARWFRLGLVEAEYADAKSKSVFYGLSQTRNYCAWLSQGGSPDLGRWISQTFEDGFFPLDPMI